MDDSMNTDNQNNTSGTIENENNVSALSSIGSEALMERECQFFKFHPLTFMDDVSESTHDYCADSADFIESCLIGHPSFSNQSFKKDIQESTNKVWELLDDSFTRNLSKFEEYVLSNILNIPNDLMLPHELLVKSNELLNNESNIEPTSNVQSNKKGNKKVDNNQNSAIINKSNMLDRELEDLRNAITKLNLENNDLKKKSIQIESEIKLMTSIDQSLENDKIIANNILPAIESINKKRIDLNSSYQIIKNMDPTKNQYLSNHENDNINSGLLDKMNNLKIDSSNIKEEVKSIENNLNLIQKIIN